MDSHELPSPQREAAFFFGLFLRGHSAEALRHDIDVSPEVLAKWRRAHPTREPGFYAEVQRVYEFRKQVLALFNFLVSSEEANNIHKM